MGYRGGYNAFFRNDGSGSFTSVDNANGAPVPVYDAGSGSTYTLSAAWADADGDGDLDLFVGNEFTSIGVSKELWLNNGRGVFVEATGSPTGGSNKVKIAAWADIDADGTCAAAARCPLPAALSAACRPFIHPPLCLSAPHIL